MWSIYTVEYYSVIGKNEILPFATTWMELEGIMLSEISPSEKDKHHMISFSKISTGVKSCIQATSLAWKPGVLFFQESKYNTAHEVCPSERSCIVFQDGSLILSAALRVF
uniref:Uncharacterized protein n=1 Tax=Ursus maritimus TaxID=29073 RepID=A0A452UXU6_URSMA